VRAPKLTTTIAVILIIIFGGLSLGFLGAFAEAVYGVWASQHETWVEAK
jgi:hypothetical protein